VTQQSKVTDHRGRPLGTTAKAGDIVTSRWSSAGVKWRVEAVVSPWNQFYPARLDLQSLSSTRKSIRVATDVVIVERAPEPQQETP